MRESGRQLPRQTSVPSTSINSKLIQKQDLKKHYSYTGMPEDMRESLLTNDFEEKKEEKIDLGGSNDSRNAFKGMNFDSDLEIAKAL